MRAGFGPLYSTQFCVSVDVASDCMASLCMSAMFTLTSGACASCFGSVYLSQLEINFNFSCLVTKGDGIAKKVRFMFLPVSCFSLIGGFPGFHL